MNIQLLTSSDEITEDLIDNPSGSSEQENKPLKKKRRIFPIILIIVLLLAVGIGIYCFYIVNKSKGLKDNTFRTCTSIDNTIYTGLINRNNTVSKVENGQVTEFAALPENYNCTDLLYNENENLFYSLGSKEENDISEDAIFSINPDGSVNQKIFHTSNPSSNELFIYYDHFQYVQGNFYALRSEDNKENVSKTIVKITPEGNMEDFYTVKTGTSEYVHSMIANNNTIYCAYGNENNGIKLITLENLNGDLKVSESPFDPNFSFFYNCNDDYIIYYSFVEDEEEQNSVRKVMKYSIGDKSTEELLSLNYNEYEVQNVFGDYIYYSQEFDDYNENGISSIPAKIFKYNWETKETTGVLDKVFNPADFGVTEKTTLAGVSVDYVTDSGDKILYNLFLGNSSTNNDLYFICNSDGSDDKLLNNRVITN